MVPFQVLRLTENFAKGQNPFYVLIPDGKTYSKGMRSFAIGSKGLCQTFVIRILCWKKLDYAIETNEP